jgi:type II secretory pathway component HofQ
MDFQGITLRNAFRLLAEQAGINIIVGNEVQGTTTLRLFQVPLGQVIDTILNTNDLDRIMIGNVMRVGSRNVIQGLKKERREEYENRLKEIDANISNINAQITDKERKVVDLEKSLTQEPEVVEDSKTEEIGEAECVVIGGKNVCFFYTTVTLVYADPAKIVNILRCMFNLDCPGGSSETARSASQQAVDAETRRVMEQGFSPTGNQGRDRILQAQQAASAQQQAEAQTAQAQTLAQGARLGLGAQQQGSLLDPDLVKIIVHSVLWANADYKRIFIKDTAERIAQMRRVIATLDIPQPQVQVESRIVRAARDWSRGLGILWGGRHTQTRAVGQDKNPMYGITGAAGAVSNTALTSGTATPPPFPDSSLPASQYMINLPSTAVNSGLSFLFGFAQGNLIDDLELQLQIGEANQLVRTIGRPKIQVLDGKTATIQSGTRIPYGNLLETQFVDATLSLNVEPHIFADGRIQMRITVTDNAPGSTTPTGQTNIDVRNATTTLIAKDGDVIVIGGIVRNTNTDVKNGWPGLMNVPILNTLFSNKTRVKSLEELYFFLSPTIIKRPPAAA